MRHLHRTHRVSVDWLHETFERGDIVLLYETSERQCADIFTKSFVHQPLAVELGPGHKRKSPVLDVDANGTTPRRFVAVVSVS